jgi:hypothetical protein
MLRSFVIGNLFYPQAIRKTSTGSILPHLSVAPDRDFDGAARASHSEDRGHCESGGLADEEGVVRRTLQGHEHVPVSDGEAGGLHPHPGRPDLLRGEVHLRGHLQAFGLQQQ